ncbi:hypothetical protein HA402_000130 [Bradysia odoriphaga]|nr:hypothetical protein HA402_000130 [Bradysia odoriphaga]
MGQKFRHLAGCIVLIWVFNTAMVATKTDGEFVEQDPVCLPIPNDCSFYRRCLEEVIPCGEEGYALGFGEFFCEKFKQNAHRFSVHGHKWMVSVMNCLQGQLIPISNGEEIMNCTEIHTFALASHRACYLNPGGGLSFCTIPQTDWAVVADVIGNSDLVDSVARDCEQDSPALCLPKPNDCSFYRICLEKRVPCGDDGYALGFGEFYCQAFKENSNRFSAPGQEWLESVMYCLQSVLVPVANGKEVMNCIEIREFAITSHYNCYINPGGNHSICTIPRTDWIQLFIIIVNELNDPATWELMLEVARTCAGGHHNVF